MYSLRAGEILGIASEHIASGRLSEYLKSAADRTWDLAVWLQHYADATPWDAELVLDATEHDNHLRNGDTPPPYGPAPAMFKIWVVQSGERWRHHLKGTVSNVA